MPPRELISVVDDDESIRESLPDLLEFMGFAVRPFASAGDFLASDAVTETRCLILDVSMPVMSGPELHDELSRRGVTPPIIYVTAQCDPNLRAILLARGAVDCLFKPFNEKELCAAIEVAVHKQSTPSP